MKQKTLAKLMGYSVQNVTDLKSGRIKFTRDSARLAEQITGISRLKWLYPKEYGDPWVELKSLGEHVDCRIAQTSVKNQILNKDAPPI